MAQKTFMILNHGHEPREVWTEDVSGFTDNPFVNTTPDVWFVRNPATGQVSREEELWYINHDGIRDKLAVRSKFFVQPPSVGAGPQIAVWFEHIDDDGDGMGDSFHVIAHIAPDGRRRRATLGRKHYRTPPDRQPVEFVLEDM